MNSLYMHLEMAFVSRLMPTLVTEIFLHFLTFLLLMNNINMPLQVRFFAGLVFADGAPMIFDLVVDGLNVLFHLVFLISLVITLGAVTVQIFLMSICNVIF